MIGQNRHAHAWMPSSPCGEGCLPTDGRGVAITTIWVRAIAAVTLLTIAPLLGAARLLPATFRENLYRRCAGVLLRCVGVRAVIVDRRDRRGYTGGTLVVAPHVSWIDVLVLISVAPSGFVARADLLEQGFLGWLSRRMRIIPIERERLRTLPRVIDDIRSRLASGERIALFPEGTTWCGRTRGGFRPALLQAAIDAECPVQPVALRYLDSTGAQTTEPAFVGEERIGPSIRRLIRSRDVVAEIVLAPLEWPGQDRRDLAARCDRAVRDGFGRTALRRAVLPSYLPTRRPAPTRPGQELVP